MSWLPYDSAGCLTLVHYISKITSTYNNYADNSDTYATSPVIDLTGFTDLRLQIDVRFDLINDADDAMNIEYSSDGGTIWNVLGTTTEPAANKWYNETSCVKVRMLTYNSFPLYPINFSSSSPLFLFFLTFIFPLLTLFIFLCLFTIIAFTRLWHFVFALGIF